MCATTLLLTDAILLLLSLYIYIMVCIVCRSSGLEGVCREVEMDTKRLAKRNLDRDDRYHCWA